MLLVVHQARNKSTRPSRCKARRQRALRVESLEARCVLSTTYLAHDLVSDQPGVAPVTDMNLVNAWGISMGPTSGFWVSSNGKDISTVYTGDVPGSPLMKNDLEVSIPGGAPTGQVFNTTMSDFMIPTPNPTAKASFIFASEAGTISGWNPNVPAPNSTTAVLGYTSPDGAIYKGIALANDSVNGNNYLYAADFHGNKIDVIDTHFHLVTPGTLGGTFTDDKLPAGFAPFNVAAINGQIYVAYAQQDAAKKDEVAGAGLGYVDVFTTDGVFVKRFASQGKLDAPWAMVLAPANFGDFSGDLLVGNFGNGRINAYDATTGAFQGTLSSSKNHPLVIDGLWGLAFGNGTNAGDTNTLYYAAGPDDESHGLFGKITANPPGTSPITTALTGDMLSIVGGRDSDHILVRLKRPTNQLIVQSEGQVLGTFDAAAVGTIEIQGFAGNDHIMVGPKVDATVIIDGGADNDKLFGGDGPNVLLGGPGHDMLFGSAARDVLIGGEGPDLLHGFRNDDILIGGSTLHDGDLPRLMQILAEWNSSDSFNTRMMKLSTGANGLPPLDSMTVMDDGMVDRLIGGPGTNWYFAGSDDFQTKH